MIGGGSKGIWKLVVTSERDLALLNCIELIFPSAIYCCNLDSMICYPTDSGLYLPILIWDSGEMLG